MLQTAPPPLRESPPVIRWPEVAHVVGVTKVKRTGPRQPRAGGPAGSAPVPPQSRTTATNGAFRASPRPDVAARNGVPATLRVAEAAEVLGNLPAQPADAACRTPSPPGRGQLCRLTRGVRSSRGNGAIASPLTGVKAPSPPLARDAGVAVGAGRRGGRGAATPGWPWGPRRWARGADAAWSGARGDAAAAGAGGWRAPAGPLPCGEWRIAHSGV
jgi:hypothetical protein